MKSIWKVELDPENLTAMLPVGAKLLTAQGQNNKVFVWAEVDTKADKEKVIFQVFRTGHMMPENIMEQLEYVGTAQLNDGYLVFHAYRFI